MDAVKCGDHRLLATPAAAGLGITADGMVGQLQAGDGLASGEQLQAAVVPAVRGVGIAQQGVDLLGDCFFASGRLITHGPVHRLPPDDPARQAVGHRQLPVQTVGPRHQLQTGQGKTITSAEGLLAVALARPAVLRRQHQHQGSTVPQHQQVRGSEEDSQVRASAIHVGEHRAQAGREADPAAAAEHAGVGAQGVAEEARGPGRIEALAVGRLRFPFALGEVKLLAAAAVKSGEQRPAVGGDLEGLTQTNESQMGLPQEW